MNTAACSNCYGSGFGVDGKPCPFAPHKPFTPDKPKKMVTQSEAEMLAREAIQKYLNDCRLQTIEDAGNALMKLLSVAGVIMCATIGKDEAVERLEGTAAFIAKQDFGQWKMERAS